jgi:hypothetical protein
MQVDMREKEENLPVASFRIMLRLRWAFVYVQSPMTSGSLSIVLS